jgi:hypothetical protein
MARANAARTRMSSIVQRVFALDEYGRALNDLAVPGRDAELRRLGDSRSGEKPVVLFLTANPDATTALNLQREMQDIRDRLRETRHGRDFELEYEPAARFLDLAFYIADARPTLIHFSGHGLVEGIALEDNTGAARIVSNDALWRLFAQPDITENLRLVVLNSCFSQAQAMTIVQHIDCVVGMSTRVPDETARAFSRGFYTALGSGLPVGGAFELALAQISIEALPGNEIPVILTKPGVDPRSVQISVDRSDDDVRIPQPERAAARIEQIGDKHWRATVVLPVTVDQAFDAADQALRRLGATGIQPRGRNMLVAGTGGLFGGFSATEEVVVAIGAADGNQTILTIDSRTRQPMASDSGNNESNVRQMIGLMGLEVG